jgi:hypothetical protein
MHNEAKSEATQHLRKEAKEGAMQQLVRVPLVELQGRAFDLPNMQFTHPEGAREPRDPQW